MRSRFSAVARQMTLTSRQNFRNSNHSRASVPAFSNTSTRMFTGKGADEEDSKSFARTSTISPFKAMLSATPLALMTASPVSAASLSEGAAIISTSAAKAPLVGAGLASFLKVGPVLSCQAMWVAPYPTIKQVTEDKSTKGLPPLPYFSMFANGYLWFAYGLSAGMDLTIMLPNVTGMVAGLYYSKKFVENNSGQYDLKPYYAGTAASLAAISGLLAFLPAADAQTALGYMGCVIVVAMFSGPLAVIKEVIETKSTKSLPFPMAVATVINCTLWGAYGSLVIHDPFVWAPNILGLGSGLAQLGLFAKYGFAKEEPVAADAKKSE